MRLLRTLTNNDEGNMPSLPAISGSERATLGLTAGQAVYTSLRLFYFEPSVPGAR